MSKALFNNALICIVVMLLTALLSSSCISHHGSSATALEEQEWQARKTYTLEYENSDTLSIKNIDIFIICSKWFPEKYPRLPLKVECITPDSISGMFEWSLITDCANVKKTATQIELKQTFINNALMKKQGIYLFNISLDSSTTVKDIFEVGIDVTKQEQWEKIK